MIVVVVVAWFLAASMVVIAGAARFATAGMLAPPILLGLVVVPVVAFAAVYRGSAEFRGFVLSLDLAFLVRLHMLRVVGLAFVTLYFLGRLPAGFALPAGIGDFTIAITAPVVARALATPRPVTSKAFIAWNVLGLIDFVAALTSGVAYSDAPIGFLAGDVTTALVTEFPLALIPTLVVPFFIITHLIALIRWREAARRAPATALGPSAA